MNKQNLSQRQISEVTGIPRSTVQSVLKRYQQGNILNKRRIGRPKILNHCEERYLVICAKAHPDKSAREILFSIATFSGKYLSVEMVRRTLRNNGYNRHVARKKPWIGEKNREKKLEFAKHYVNEDENFWNTVIFSDESKFEIFNTSKRKIVWRKPRSEFEPCHLCATVKYSGDL